MTEAPEIGFSSPETDVLTGYRPVNRLAIASLSLAVLSPTALINPVFWIVPVVGAVLAIAALRSFDRASAEQTGRPLALAALVASLVFASWAPARATSRQFVLYRQARPYADRWLDLVLDGRLDEAHQLTLPVEQRLPPGASLERHYAERRETDKRSMSMMSEMPEPHAELQQFFATPPLDKIVAVGRSGQWHYEGKGRQSQLGLGETSVEYRYSFSHQQDGKTETRRFSVVMVRRVGKDSAHWRVREVVDLSNPSP